ncbi:hypothetical protein D7236_19395 [Stutzerimonas stutzeri]|nr:hypothetical protein [Stutzerimonas stutzeri]
MASRLKAWFRPDGRVTFSKRPDGRPLKSNQKRFAPASGPALRSGCVTRFARPSGQPAAVTPLRSVSLRRRSEGRRTRAIHGPLRLSPHPCGSPLCATAPFTLLKGRLESSGRLCKMNRWTDLPGVQMFTWLQSSTFICVRGLTLVLASRARTSLRHAQAEA